MSKSLEHFVDIARCNRQTVAVKGEEVVELLAAGEDCLLSGCAGIVITALDRRSPVNEDGICDWILLAYSCDTQLLSTKYKH